MSLSRIAKIALSSLFADKHPAPITLAPHPAQPSPGRDLPKGFLLGVATAAHQIEGGLDNDWTEWEKGSFADGTPHIRDRTVSGAATDSWNRFADDLALMKQLGANAYRLSVEWSRLEPKEGAWNEEAANRYLDWMRQLRAHGIQPMVTLNHFTLPRWVADQGSWTNDKIIDGLEAFTRRVVDKLGAEVDLWCTINEPSVLATFSYIKGAWPPGMKDQKIAALAMARMLKAHARMTRVIRERDRTDADGDGKPALVGLAHHVRIFQPATRSPLDRVIAGFTDDFFNWAVLNANQTGRIQITIPGAVSIDEAVPDLKGSFDYLGINYYGRDHIRADLKLAELSRQYVPEGRPVNDLGWDVYPEGLYQVLKRYGKLGLPIYVTENGTADRKGEMRIEFLRSHFAALRHAVRDGVDVRGYIHWSLMDNFEWAEGYDARFGLYRVDFDSPTKPRVATPAVAEFQKLARELGLSPQG